jgi:hypothetical protein
MCSKSARRRPTLCPLRCGGGTAVADMAGGSAATKAAPALSRARLAAKAAKRAARQSADGLPAGDEELAALGWAPVDDSVRAVFDALEAAAAPGGRAGRKAAAAGARDKAAGKSSGSGSGDFTRDGWAALEADPAALLTGASEFGFVSLEARPARGRAQRTPRTHMRTVGHGMRALSRADARCV